jgi:serine/threonine-protein kinase
MPPTVVLTVQDGDDVCKELHFEGSPVSCMVGRSSDCQVRLPSDEVHDGVSRRHCLLDVEPPFAWVRDLGSLNGTYLNGVCIGARESAEAVRGRRYRLYPGDVIRVGTTLLRFDVVAESAGAAAVQEPATCEACPV